jgi:hypothetical protein
MRLGAGTVSRVSRRTVLVSPSPFLSCRLVTVLPSRHCLAVSRHAAMLRAAGPTGSRLGWSLAKCATVSQPSHGAPHEIPTRQVSPSGGERDRWAWGVALTAQKGRSRPGPPSRCAACCTRHASPFRCRLPAQRLQATLLLQKARRNAISRAAPLGIGCCHPHGLQRRNLLPSAPACSGAWPSVVTRRAARRRADGG